MKNCLKLFLVSSSLMCGIAGATGKLTSCPIYLTGGDVTPSQKLTLTIDRLPNNVSEAFYNVHCDIVNPNYSKPYPAVVRLVLNANGSGAAYLNDSNSATGQYQLNRNVNSLKVLNARVYKETNGIVKSAIIDIQNLDDTDTVRVQNCVGSLAG